MLRIRQEELLDCSFMLEDIENKLNKRVKEALLQSNSIIELVHLLDLIFLSYLTDIHADPSFAEALNRIISLKGLVGSKALAAEVFYSEKHLNRLFRKHIGTGIKTFSRIVRMNHVLRILQTPQSSLAEIAADAGYFDQAHLSHDFKTICSITPQQYLKNMSIFYNENFKL